MARTDAMVLGGGIVGTSIALHLARRGLHVALLDRRAPGEQTSFGNAGIIGSTIYPASFPRGLKTLLKVALRRAPQADYHLRALPPLLPWLLAFRAASTPERRAETARLMRPLLARAVAEHETLLGEAGATRYLRRNGFLTLYRTEQALSDLWTELALAAELGVGFKFHDVHGARELEPALAPVLEGDARSLHRAVGRWRIDTSEGPVDAEAAVIALGPWAPDVLKPRGLDLPLAIKRGYHRHFAMSGNAALGRPVVDSENGFALAPMEQGLRLTTGAEFAERDAPATPAQLRRVLPIAKTLLPLGEPVETSIWMGSRPCFADSLPVIGRAPGHPGLWLAYGHGHVGMSLGPVTGRLIAEMMLGDTPFCDPTPYAAERFG